MIQSFEDFKINKQILNAIMELGYTEPSEIQKKAIPLAMNGHDLIGIAQTGTGKTAAFLIPLIMKIKYAQGMDPRALVLAPTRELVIQIEKEGKRLASYTDLRIVALYGGTGTKRQLELLDEGVDIIIASPGRFLDLYRMKRIPTKGIKTLVLDEADRMMDMGFMPQIRKILEVVPPKKRQNMLFSATMPAKVEALSAEFLTFPEKIEVSPQATAAGTVEQLAYETPNHRTKIALLEHLLFQKEQFQRVMVFTKTKQTANDLFRFIERKVDKSVRVIHGNKDQNTRINAMESFKEGSIRILVSTDVSSRGIDVSLVSHVINFDIPVVYEDYIHRIGRTGRARQEGVAITFLNPPDRIHLAKIEKITGSKVKRVELPSTIQGFDTPKEEKIKYEKSIDALKQKEDPSFKGAFHEKKNVPKPPVKASKSGKRPYRRK